jgi:hypothetical protein
MVLCTEMARGVTHKGSYVNVVYINMSAFGLFLPWALRKPKSQNLPILRYLMVTPRTSSEK